MNAYEEYMKKMVEPMRQELSNNGFEELTTVEDVDTFIENATGTSLVVVNSVCGCAAGLARPAAVASLNHSVKPERAVTVFAGQDKAATSQMRMYFGDIEPSSPSMALLKGNEVVHFIPREQIEDNTPEGILENLISAYEKYCQ
jgi:putative YphP/YqiW family bacilliredoxin